MVKSSLFGDPVPAPETTPLVALVTSAFATEDGLAFGLSDRYSAATPTTCGVAIDVPLYDVLRYRTRADDPGAVAEYVLAGGALEGSLFRLLRQGQRVNFDVDGDGRAVRIRIGSEPDMGLPPNIQL